MNYVRPDWIKLNAYVDAELPPAEAASVAKAVADDRELAETAATLARLKAAVHETAEDPGIELPRAPASRLPRMALAACLVGVLVLAAAVLSYPFPGADAPPAWLDKAWAAHKTWATARALRANGANADASRVLAAIGRLGVQACLPDLTPAKLTLSRIEPTALAGLEQEAMHLG